MVVHNCSPALEKLRQEDHSKLKTSLIYIARSKPDMTTWWDFVSQQRNKYSKALILKQIPTWKCCVLNYIYFWFLVSSFWVQTPSRIGDKEWLSIVSQIPRDRFWSLHSIWTSQQLCLKSPVPMLPGSLWLPVCLSAVLAWTVYLTWDSWLIF